MIRFSRAYGVSTAIIGANHGADVPRPPSRKGFDGDLKLHVMQDVLRVAVVVARRFFEAGLVLEETVEPRARFFAVAD